MLVSGMNLLGTPVLSMQATAQIATVSDFVIDPSNLKILALVVSSPLTPNNILTVQSVREYSRYGIVVDSIDEIVAGEDVIKINEILNLNFSLSGLKVETKKGSKLGKVQDFTVTSDDFNIQQIIVKRPALKGFLDPELTIPRREIVEVTDYKIIVKDEEKVIKQKAATEDFIPNFVNPFRNSKQDYAPSKVESDSSKNS